MRYYKMLCVFDIKKISLRNLGKKGCVTGLGRNSSKKAVSFLVLQLSETNANE